MPTKRVAEKMHENRVRARAARYGLRLSRSRQRDGSVARSYGIWDDRAQAWVLAGPGGWGWSLAACEAYLRRIAAEHANGAVGTNDAAG
jgi:hypothetical protein